MGNAPSSADVSESLDQVDINGLGAIVLSPKSDDTDWSLSKQEKNEEMIEKTETLKTSPLTVKTTDITHIMSTSVLESPVSGDPDKPWRPPLPKVQSPTEQPSQEKLFQEKRVPLHSMPNRKFKAPRAQSQPPLRQISPRSHMKSNVSASRIAAFALRSMAPKRPQSEMSVRVLESPTEAVHYLPNKIEIGAASPEREAFKGTTDVKEESTKKEVPATSAIMEPIHTKESKDLENVNEKENSKLSKDPKPLMELRRGSGASLSSISDSVSVASMERRFRLSTEWPSEFISNTDSIEKKAEKLKSNAKPWQLSDVQLTLVLALLSTHTVTEWRIMLESEKLPFPRSNAQFIGMNQQLDSTLKEEIQSNATTHNIASLLALAVDSFSSINIWDLNENGVPTVLHNVVWFLKCVLPRLSEHGASVIELFEAPVVDDVSQHYEELETADSQVTPTRSVAFLRKLLHFLVVVDSAQDTTSEFYAECLGLLLIVLSLDQMHLFVSIVQVYLPDLAFGVVRRMIMNYIKHKSIQEPDMLKSPTEMNRKSGIFSIFSWSPPQRQNYRTDTFSVLVLLILTCNKPANRYREAFSCMRDQGRAKDSISGRSMVTEETILVPFRWLYAILAPHMNEEETTLLFYFLVTENQSFRFYALSRTDSELLMEPMLKLLYEATLQKTHYSQVYLMLVLLLIFSEDDLFNTRIHSINLNLAGWFKERTAIKQITLGSLTICVLCRVLQFNMQKLRDIYLHNTCVAILGNMSSHLRYLHVYAAQRIVDLIDVFSKKWIQLQLLDPQGHSCEIYGDVLGLLLEMVSHCLLRQLKYNAHLVYAFMYNTPVLDRLRVKELFTPLIENIDRVLAFCHGKLSVLNMEDTSSEQLFATLENALREMPSGRLVALPPMKFKYEEESDSVQFFAPYIRYLVHREGLIPLI